MVETASFRDKKQNNTNKKKGTNKMATELLCKAVAFKNPKTGDFGQRAAVVLKDYRSNELYDFAAANGYLPAGSKKEVIVPAFSGLMAAAKALIETTGNSRVVLSDWLAVSPTLRNATLEAGNIPATARLVTALRVHSELRLDPTKFNLVLEGYDDALVPKVDFLISAAAGAARSKLVRGQAIMVNGRSFGEDDDALAVTFSWTEGAEEHTVTARIASCGENLIAIAWPQEFTDLPAGTEVTAVVKRTVDERDYLSKPKGAVIE